MTVTNEKVVKGKGINCNRGNQDCEMWKGTISDRGFSLVELIIVIAIMAVLVGILTPQYLSYMHRARVAADWANLKNYYTEITLDYITTGQYNPNVPVVDYYNPDQTQWKQTEIHFLNGQTARMKDGYFAVTKESTANGYQIIYDCNEYPASNYDEKHRDSCELILK